ncbi:MAG: hypothetical protein ABSE48_06605 [Verrucomicrobiota bacterium]|jgi:hypothetical protein
MLQFKNGKAVGVGNVSVAGKCASLADAGQISQLSLAARTQIRDVDKSI